jgi:hypothetical protein
MRVACLCSCLFFCLFQLDVRAEEKPDPRATVEAALRHAIALFEQRDLGKFIQDSIRSQDREDLLQRSSAEEFTKQLSASPDFEAHRKVQIAIWKEFKTMTPTYNEDKTIATFPAINQPGVRHSLVFEIERGLWRINVAESVATSTVPLQRKN